jgi:glycosyltransferase involved in cell wall biosynthesis
MSTGLSRVLVVHNAYQHRGGEDSVVEAEIALLRSRGHEVAFYGRNNDEVANASRLSLARQTFWSTRTTQDAQRLIADFEPDLIHVHNTFPLISPSLYWAAARARVPVVQTLHNFRLLCPQAMFLRDGKVCEDCKGRMPLPAVVHGCYRGSRATTAVLGGMLSMHRMLGTWQHKVTRYVALNEFCRQKFIEGGLPAERIVLKPNFVDFAAPAAGGREGFLFVGRLSAEKGLQILLDAAQQAPELSLCVAGSGPQADLLASQPAVHALGALDGDGVRAAMSDAMALVLPSIWYENFPRTIVEAFGCGLPVIASRLGALAEIVEDSVTGLLFEAGNARDLAEKMRWAQANPQRMADMGRAARAEYEARYTATKNYDMLMNIYNEAIAVEHTDA